MKDNVFIGFLALTLIGAGAFYYLTHRPVELYPPVFSANFTGACLERGATQEYCGCALGIVKDMYTYKEAVAFTEPPQALESAVAVQCASLN